jgi:hypothetical protein
MYKVNTFFTDLQDNRYAYKAGDVFPRNGLEVSDDRLKELSSIHNRRGIPLITLVEEETTEPVADFMNPPIEDETEEETETVEEKPKKKRGRPRNDAE